MTEAVNEKEIGAAVLRLQHDQATEADVAAVCNMIVRSPEFRDRCSVLGAMANHLPARKREENAEAMGHVVFEKHPPAEEQDAEWDPEGENSAWGTPTARWIVQSGPMRGTHWVPHFEAVEYAPSDAIKSCRLSPYATAVVRAIEEMWGLESHLID